MENMTTKITSSYNNALDIKVVDGHFATNHSHINRYIDMTTIKSRRKMALAAAKSMATEYGARNLRPDMSPEGESGPSGVFHLSI